MKLGIITPAKVESFNTTAKFGLSFLEFCINIEQDVNQFTALIPQLKTASEQTRVGVGSIGRWGADRIIAADGTIIEGELQASYALIDAAQQLGCPIFVCGCNYVKERSFYDNVSSAIAYFAKLIEYGKPKGVRIATYNCHWNSFVVDDTAWRLIHGHLPDLGIKYDPSHARYAGQDYLKEMRDWGHRFVHVHIKGSVIINGERFDDPPAGMDQTDWGTFMAILYGVGYDGGLSIEPHSHTWAGELGERGIEYTVSYMNKLLFQ
jgi:sugar phosphate isomerase/epimerase